MPNRIFKKRVLVLDTATCSGGTYTFLKNWFPLLNKLDIVVDHISFRDNEKCIKSFMENENYNVLFNNVTKDIKESNLSEAFKFIDNDVMFYASFMNNPIIDYKMLETIHSALSKNIYDFIFIDHQDFIKPLLSITQLDKIIPIIVYTHSSHIFQNFKSSGSFYFEPYKSTIVNLIKDSNVKVVSQKVNSYIENDLGIVEYDIAGLPLDLDRIKKGFDNSKKEDAVLYLGRVEQGSKNVEGWCKAVGQTDYKAIAIVPSKQNANKMEQLFKKYNITNFEIHHSLTQKEQISISNKAKVFFSSSFIETFGYVVYENANLMKVIALEESWSKDVTTVFPFLEIADEKKIVDLIEKAMSEYSEESILGQQKILEDYQKELVKQWESIFDFAFDEKDKKNTTKIIEALESKNTLTKAIESIGRLIDFQEFRSLYGNLDRSKIIQTKEETFYNEIIKSDNDDIILF